MKSNKTMSLSLVSLIFIWNFFATDYVHGKESLHSIKNAINSLSSTNPFIFFYPQISDKELRAFNTIKISKTDEYNNYGNINVLENEVESFINTLDRKNKNYAKKVAQFIKRLVKDVLKASGQETAWIAVRAFTPTPEYNIPRWHTDGYYYKPYEHQYKFVVTLKGQSTLFYKLPSDMRTQFFLLQDDYKIQDNHKRKSLANMLNEPSRRFQPKLAQMATYIVGSDNSAIHSEPPISEARLFLSILPGSRSQIKEWKSNQ
ncbi:MAG: hypothetical protein K2Y08_05300 [Alphaproteobacteria bacterium]|nr:hypothetical protein [Alphaproteobacteria bacterium]